MSLNWLGDEIIKKMDNCIIQGMAQTITKCVEHAKNKHPWKNRSTHLEGSIKEQKHPRKVGNEFIGVWGSVDINYALVLELGGVNMPPFPYLRPAADAEYPKLADRIRRCFKGGKTLVRKETVTLRSGRDIEVFRPI